MPRKPRVHFPGAVYHVITRGNNQDKIFASKKDKHYYLDKINELRLKFIFELLIYAVMDNHSHLTIRVENTPLSKIMHHLQQSYAIYYNREYNQSGHVFENRYKAYLCDNDRYLLALLRYIHLNPFSAKITSDLEYPWSSHGHYSGKIKNNLVSKSLIYQILLQEQDLDPAAAYLLFMKQTTEDLPLPRYLSSLEEKPHEIKIAADDLFQMIEKISTSHNIEKGQLFSKSRDSAASAARKELILTLYHRYHWKNKNIVELLRVNKSYVSKIIANNPDPHLVNLVPGTGFTNLPDPTK